VPGIDTIPELMSIDQLAQRLGITVRHVRRLIAEERVPYLKVGRLVRFDPAEIATWLAESRRPRAHGTGSHDSPPSYPASRAASPARHRQIPERRSPDHRT
jgi:excisionase family DNA binding protein